MKKIILIFILIITFCSSVFAVSMSNSLPENFFQKIEIHLGVPYRWGEDGPNLFDCSGFVRYCFLEYLDIELPHNSYQISQDERLIKVEKYEELLPGDILCLGQNKTTHVAIYLGNDVMIHCATDTKEVAISELIEEAYYSHNFLFARRYIYPNITLDCIDK